jgi:hypothetical protein
MPSRNKCKSILEKENICPAPPVISKNTFQTMPVTKSEAFRHTKRIMTNNDKECSKMSDGQHVTDPGISASTVQYKGT